MLFKQHLDQNDSCNLVAEINDMHMHACFFKLVIAN
jgi:hypothetical protein